MGTIIYRGSTPVIKFKPQNGINVSDLGTPSVAIAQELVYLTPEVTIDSASNSISVKLTEEESLQLVEGVPTTAQEIWKNESGDVIRFPTHQLTVAATIMETVEETPAPEPELDVLENEHPFFEYSPFAETGYWIRYMDEETEEPETITDIFTGDGETLQYVLSKTAETLNYSVTVNGQEVFDEVEKSDSYVIFDTPPVAGASISVVYDTVIRHEPDETVLGWEAETSPWTDHSANGIFSFSVTNDFNRFTVTPANCSSLETDAFYYLWIFSPTATRCTISANCGAGYALEFVEPSPSTSSSAVSGNATSFTVNLGSGSDGVLLKMKALDYSIAAPLFAADMNFPTNAEDAKLCIALYKITEGRPESDYKQYVPFDRSM